MALLTDTDLREMICPEEKWSDTDKIHIHPFSEENLTPIGYDFTVGTLYSSTRAGGPFKLKKTDRITIKPADVLLVHTFEKLEMPKNKTISGLVASRVSRVSEGLSHVSTTVDPDWRGKLLIALTNYSRKPVVLKVGDGLCTVVFFENKTPATKDCGKTTDRADIFLKKIAKQAEGKEKSRRASKEFLKLGTPLLTILAFGIAGYCIFGEKAGFAALTAIGIGVSETIRWLITRKKANKEV